MKLSQKIAAIALWAGIAVPVIYFGIQLVGALFFPGYDFITRTASEIGTAASITPVVFNTGVVLAGVMGLAAAAGYVLALLHIRANAILAWLTGLAVATGALTSLWAGMYPLPDPRHSAVPPIGLLLMPPLFLAAVWPRGDARLLKAYLIACIVLIIVFIPIMSGLARIDIREVQGLVQRAFALTVFPEIGVGAYYLLRRVTRQPDPDAQIAG